MFFIGHPFRIWLSHCVLFRRVRQDESFSRVYAGQESKRKGGLTLAALPAFAKDIAPILGHGVTSRHFGLFAPALLLYRVLPDCSASPVSLSTECRVLGTMKAMPAWLSQLQRDIVACELCPRLRAHCSKIAREKRRAYLDWEYWGKPVPGFGDPAARVLVIGLAPGAHGSNRTGRPFTGDGSGATLYRVLYRAGFASLPESKTRDDEMRLLDAYITAAVRCAPPGNKPAREEIV